MEQLIRILSWTFVFGAIATLLYTNFKPAWKELLDSDVPVERVQGSATGGDAAVDRSDATTNTGAPADPCATPARAERPDGCDLPSS